MSPLRRVEKVVGKDGKLAVDSRRVESSQALMVASPLEAELFVMSQSLREINQTLKMIAGVLGAGADISE